MKRWATCSSELSFIIFFIQLVFFAHCDCFIHSSFDSARFVAKEIGFNNTQTPLDQEPPTNLTRIYPGPLNPAKWITFTAPPQIVSRFGGRTLLLPSLDQSINMESVGDPIALTYYVSAPPSSLF